MHSDPDGFGHSSDSSSDHSARDGFFDGSADDVQDLHHGFGSKSRSRRRYRHADLSGAPSWVKALVWAGTLVALAGMGIVVIGFVTSMGGPDPVSTPLTPAFPVVAPPPGFPVDQLPPELQSPGFPADQLPPEFQSPGATEFPVLGRGVTRAPDGPNPGLGFGIFFVGLVLAAIGALGHSTSTRR
ncbi:hypothetical protein [Lentzea sp. NPDC003310]|uniref:hypothetical protein n=1 Tax=Lentzea sp. NPDC003310 TaxID=3154447 RepID=UPI0033B11C41